MIPPVVPVHPGPNIRRFVTAPSTLTRGKPGNDDDVGPCGHRVIDEFSNIGYLLIGRESSHELDGNEAGTLRFASDPPETPNSVGARTAQHLPGVCRVGGSPSSDLSQRTRSERETPYHLLFSSPGELFLTLPTSLLTSNASISSAGKGRSRSIGGQDGSESRSSPPRRAWWWILESHPARAVR